MKKAMLFLATLFFAVSVNAATYTITQTAGTGFAVVDNGTSSVQASFQGDAMFDLEVIAPVDNDTLVNFDFIPEAGFISGTLEIVGVDTFDLSANFATRIALAADIYKVIFDITPDSTGIQQFSVSEVPVPAAAFLFAPALVS